MAPGINYSNSVNSAGQPERGRFETEEQFRVRASGQSTPSTWVTDLLQSRNVGLNAMVSTGLGGGDTTPAAAPQAPMAPAVAMTPSAPSSTVAGVPTNLLSQTPATAGVSAAAAVGNAAGDEAFNSLMQQMSTVSNSQLRGEIPADVEAQVRRTAAEKGLFYGLGAGSPANRALTARDLGTTSIAIQQQGQSTGQALAALAESRRQFNETNAMQYRSYMEDVRRGDLSAAQLQETSRQFQAQQRLAATELLTNALQAYHEMTYRWSAIEEPTEGQSVTMANYERDVAQSIAQMRANLGGGY